jgi:hypothetical protein
MRPRSSIVREYFLLDMNMVIRLLIMSDVIWMGATGLLGPIFSLYVVDFIQGADAAVAGTAAAIYLVTKSLLQVPVATIIDKVRGERDDYWFLICGSLTAALMPLSYLFIDTAAQLYAVQFALGAITAVTFPSYMAIFTRHIDHAREGTEWGVYFTLVDLSSAVAASVGGVMSTVVGFPTLIIAMSCISIVGASLLLPIRKYMRATGAVGSAEKASK